LPFYRAHVHITTSIYSFPHRFRLLRILRMLTNAADASNVDVVSIEPVPYRRDVVQVNGYVYFVADRPFHTPRWVHDGSMTVRLERVEPWRPPQLNYTNAVVVTDQPLKRGLKPLAIVNGEVRVRLCKPMEGCQLVPLITGWPPTAKGEVELSDGTKVNNAPAAPYPLSCTSCMRVWAEWVEKGLKPFPVGIAKPTKPAKPVKGRRKGGRRYRRH